jgi:hypothetical protein
MSTNNVADDIKVSGSNALAKAIDVCPFHSDVTFEWVTLMLSGTLMRLLPLL